MLRSIFIIFILVIGVVYAEEDAVTTQQDNSQEKTKPIDDAAEETTPEVLTPDTFDPTEKLSEDISAAFPIDI